MAEFTGFLIWWDFTQSHHGEATALAAALRALTDRAPAVPEGPLTQSTLRQALVATLEAHGAVRLRERGGVYYLPQDATQLAHGLVALAPDHGMRLHACPVAGAEWAAAVADAVQRPILAELQRAIDRAEAIKMCLARQQPVHPRASNCLISDLKKLSEQIDRQRHLTGKTVLLRNAATYIGETVSNLTQASREAVALARTGEAGKAKAERLLDSWVKNTQFRLDWLKEGNQ